MDKEQKEKQLREIVQAIAMSAMEAPPERRMEFIEHAVGKMCKIYEAGQRRAPIPAHQVRMLLDLTREMVRTLEKSGNTVGRA